MRWDPEYVYVDEGEEFRKSHAAIYANGEIPTITIGSAIWARDHLLKFGGSGYLPERLIGTDIKLGKLHKVPDAPQFLRNTYWVVNFSVDKFTWLPDIVTDIGTAQVSDPIMHRT